MIMFGSFLPSLLVGFSTTNFTRASEPTLSWNQLHSKPLPDRVNERKRLIYKRGCQGYFSPSTGRRERFRDFQPLFVMRAVGFWFSAL
jgi:hypothetical protein